MRFIRTQIMSTCIYMHLCMFSHAQCLVNALCMLILWTSQLSYSCLVWPLCLIIYSQPSHTAGWLCSLQLVFPISPHLACLNKTISILKDLRSNRAVTPHRLQLDGSSSRSTQPSCLNSQITLASLLMIYNKSNEDILYVCFMFCIIKVKRLEKVWVFTSLLSHTN